MGKPAWSTEQKLIVQALINLGCDNFYIEVKTRVPYSTLVTTPYRRYYDGCANGPGM
jgi:hypothetical protein